MVLTVLKSDRGSRQGVGGLVEKGYFVGGVENQFGGDLTSKTKVIEFQSILWVGNYQKTLQNRKIQKMGGMGAG